MYYVNEMLYVYSCMSTYANDSGILYVTHMPDNGSENYVPGHSGDYLFSQRKH